MGVAQTYPLRVAAQAAHSSEKTLRRWLDNHVITLRGNDSTATGTGNPCGWSRARIVQAAITQALVERNHPPSASAKAAVKFTDESQTGRDSGELFKHGKSILVIGPEGATVKNLLYDATLADVSNRGVCSITVDLTRIVESVDTILKEVKTR
jgi:hypothetical protein